MAQKPLLKKPRQNAFTAPYVLAVGASAGGLEALQELLTHYPATLKNVAIIIAQHLSPTHKSMLVELLRKETTLHVEEATDGKPLSPNVVYITPPNADISIEKKLIKLTKPLSSIGPKPSVDILFSAVARTYKKKAIAVILSGTGTDGSIGIGAIKKSGGFVIVQDPESAKFNGMPNTAIATGMIDMILRADKIGAIIEQHIINPGDDINNTLESSTPSAAWTKIFNLLSKHTGTDFSHYKPSTIGRRLSKRLGILKIKTPEAYYTYLKEHPAELDELFFIFLISVTNFFRDKEAFTVLGNILRKIILKKSAGDSIRIWVAACATGEEAYSIAILIADILKDNIDDFHIQIFATDIDDKAIQIARKGIYSAKTTEEIPEHILNTYFTNTEQGYEIVKPIKGMILFSRHDVAGNPPFLKLDLLSCRNLLIYFDDVLQKQIFPIFHYALNAEGYLFLGRAETIGHFSDLFTIVDEKNKFYQRKPAANRNLRLAPYTIPLKAKADVKEKSLQGIHSIKDLIKETLFNAYEHPYVVINDQYDIQQVNGDVRLYLSFQEGNFNANILKLVNSDLQIELRSVITKCFKEQQQVKSITRKFELFDKIHYLRITARPTIGEFQGQRYYIIIFEQVEKNEFLYQANPVLLNDPAAIDVAELEQELAATKEHLQTYIEELETANEELQSLNEELQSTNEELQSTNEELETTNEELQSTSEEVQITYSELKASYSELKQKETEIRLSEANLNSLLNNGLQVFYLADCDYKIVAFNKRAEETVWQLYNKKIKAGDTVFEILNPENLDAFVRHFKLALSGETVTGDTNVTDTAGNSLWYLYSYTPVITKDGTITGVTFSYLDVTEARRVAANLHLTEKLLSSVFNATSVGMAVIDEQGFFTDVNRAFCMMYQYEKEELIGKSFVLLADDSSNDSALQRHVDFMEGNLIEDGMEATAYKKDKTPFDIHVTSELMIQNDGKRYKVQSVRDISIEKRAYRLINASEAKYKAIVDNSLHAFFLTDQHGVILEANYASTKLLGYTEKELIQLGSKRIIDHDILLQEKIEERNKKGYVSGELTAFKKNGAKIDCEFSSIVFKDINGEEKVSTIITDITERKKLQKLLDDTNQLAKVGGWELDMDNNMVYWSAATKEIHEVAPDFIPQLDNAILFYKEGDNRDKLTELLHKAMHTGEPWDVELQIITALGKERWIRISSKAEFKNGKVIRLYGATQDIHEKKLAEEKLKELNQQMTVQVNKLEVSNAELEQFAYVASHDLQEPLRMVTSFVQLLENKYSNELDDTARQYIHFAADGADRMKKLILDLLEYSRVGTNTSIAGNTDMNEVVEEVLHIFKTKIEESGAEITITSPLPVLPNTRKIQMVQLMQNLIGNALKYRNSSKPLIIIDTEEQPDQWLFSIKDNGIGFDEKFAEKIFIIFQRLHNTKDYSGTGIGLSICKKIIELHGGKIWAASVAGTGSVFYFQLLK